MRRGIVIKTVINQMTFDGATKDPIQMAVRDALIGFMAATAQAQAEATKVAQKAGIAEARERAGSLKYRGRKPSFTREQMESVFALLSTGAAGTSEIARATKLSRQTVLRLAADRAKAERILAMWVS